MTQPHPLPADDATASPAFRRVLAAAAAVAAFWLVCRFAPDSAVATAAAAGVALATGVLAFRNATFLLAAFVALMPAALFAVAIAGL